MTIQQLIDELTKLPNKDRDIKAGRYEGDENGDWLELRSVVGISEEQDRKKERPSVPYIYIASCY